MQSTPIAIGVSVALGLAAAGCGKDSLDDPDNVRTWVNTGSALAVYSRAHDAISFAAGRGAFTDPKCPATSDDGTTATISGGCTDSKGVVWVGAATVARAMDGSETVKLDGYGHNSDPNLLARVTGNFSFHPIDAMSHSFDASFVEQGGLKTTVQYAGTVLGDFDSATTWGGSGTIARDGLVAPTGNVHATTTAEVVDDRLCSGQPASGQTRIEDEDHVAIVTYDGKTDCDDAKAATWTFDGEDHGQITGITCSTGAPARRGGGYGILFLTVALVASKRRRARSVRAPIRRCPFYRHER